MNKLVKSFFGILALALIIWAGVSFISTTKPDTSSFGATIATTSQTDTIGTFRTNVNLSLENLNNAINAVSLSNVVTSILFGSNIVPSNATGTVTMAVTSTPVFTSVSSTQATHTTVTTTNLAVTGLGTSGCLRFSGSATISTTSCPGTFQFIIENPTASENDAIFIPKTTSTLDKVIVVNKSNFDTVTWNLGFSSSTRRDLATSTLWNVFSSVQVSTATTTPSILTPNGSTTLSANAPLIFWTTAASSSQFSATFYYHEN